MTPRECKAWEELQGRRLEGGKYTLRVRTYVDAFRAALYAETKDGEPECRLTVNIADQPLGEGEFFARIEDISYAPLVFEALTRSGVAEPTGKVVSAGMSDRYAEVWRLRAAKEWGVDHG